MACGLKRMPSRLLSCSQSIPLAHPRSPGGVSVCPSRVLRTWPKSSPTLRLQMWMRAWRNRSRHNLLHWSSRNLFSSSSDGETYWCHVAKMRECLSFRISVVLRCCAYTHGILKPFERALHNRGPLKSYRSMAKVAILLIAHNKVICAFHHANHYLRRQLSPMPIPTCVCTPAVQL